MREIYRYLGLPPPVRSAFRVFHPPDDFLPPSSSGPVSYRSRSWGSSLQSFFLRLQPPRLSTRVPLLTSVSLSFARTAVTSFRRADRESDAPLGRRGERASKRTTRLQGLAPQRSPTRYQGYFTNSVPPLLSWALVLSGALRRRTPRDAIMGDRSSPMFSGPTREKGRNPLRSLAPDISESLSIRACGPLSQHRRPP